MFSEKTQAHVNIKLLSNHAKYHALSHIDSMNNMGKPDDNSLLANVLFKRSSKNRPTTGYETVPISLPLFRGGRGDSDEWIYVARKV